MEERAEGIPQARLTNERLEFLGDAELGAIVAEYLYADDPDADEGTLTRRRVALVRTETLVRWARDLGIADVLVVGQGERPSESARDRMLAGAFEALIGAIALDQGRAAAKRFVVRFLKRDARSILDREEPAANPKGRLQEAMQARHRQSPVYTTIAAAGPDHARTFTVEVGIRGRTIGTGTGPSKREAEQRAAEDALARLDQRPSGKTAGDDRRRRAAGKYLGVEGEGGERSGPWPSTTTS